MTNWMNSEHSCLNAMSQDMSSFCVWKCPSFIGIIIMCYCNNLMWQIKIIIVTWRYSITRAQIHKIKLYLSLCFTFWDYCPFVLLHYWTTIFIAILAPSFILKLQALQWLHTPTGNGVCLNGTLLLHRLFVWTDGSWETCQIVFHCFGGALCTQLF